MKLFKKESRFDETVPEEIRELARKNRVPLPNRWIPSAHGSAARLNGHRVAFEHDDALGETAQRPKTAEAGRT